MIDRKVKPGIVLLLGPCFLAGCSAAQPAVVLPAEPAAVPASAAPETQKTIAKRKDALPTMPLEAANGVWHSEPGQYRTWLRLEHPRFWLVTGDRAGDRLWIMDGYFQQAADGLVYGVATRLESRTGGRAYLETLYAGDERALRAESKANMLQPFYCRLRRSGELLRVEDFYGPGLEALPRPCLDTAFQKAALARPSRVPPMLPLGSWENSLLSPRDRIMLRFDAKQVELKVYPRGTGKRIRYQGEYTAAPGQLLFGVFNRMEDTMIPGQPPPLDPPRPFCIHFGEKNQSLVILEASMPGFDEATCRQMKGEFRRGQ
jgi:hypothetical protein